ncbi:MAG TPA: hypothetical protein VHZ24_17745 [Pirellulales bacterium]|jgi:hypothetical protein|nr:hypothetical protein [Pirellulales bacterium]
MKLLTPLAAAIVLAGGYVAQGAATDGGEHVLFAFDDHALPLQHGVRLRLLSYRSPGEEGGSNIVVPVGPPGSCDGRGVIYYGTVLEVDGELRMWYLGMGDQDERRHYRICYATSSDGKKWEKPGLGLVEYGGSRHNNLVDLDQGRFSVAGCVVYHDPADADPQRRFKMLFTGTKYPGLLFGVAYSADGLSWTESSDNPRGTIKFEPQGGIQYNGAFYVNGQGGMHWAPDGWIRTLVTHVSYDFENWTHATALGFRRDPLPPRPVGHTGGVDGEQVHLGAGLWNRGNVVLGIYGQWHGDATNDRRWVPMDLGLLVSHDALHFREPIPDFRIVQAAENTSSWLPGGRATPLERAPALMQGQGFANLGKETLFWYSVWVVPSAGLRVARWDRDRLGYLTPFSGPKHKAHVISAPVPTGGKPVAIKLNVGGIGEYSGVKVSVLDEHLRELPGYSAAECTGPERSGFSERATWGRQRRVVAEGSIRVRVDFTGIRPEDLQLFAVYVEPD